MVYIMVLKATKRAEKKKVKWIQKGKALKTEAVGVSTFRGRKNKKNPRRRLTWRGW